MKFEILNFLSQVFLFNNVCEQDLNEIIKTISPEIIEYEPKAEIYTPNAYEHKIGFIVNGECAVERIKNDGNAVPLNTLRSGDSFGIMTVLSCSDEFPTKVVAKKKSRIVFITKKDTLYLINQHSQIAMNVISFLAKKIEFLNNKVATFSSDTVEEKLANFIFLEYKKRNSVEFPFNCKKTAEVINSGRASLYRAITALNDENIIRLENKKIIILDPEGLERNTK